MKIMILFALVIASSINAMDRVQLYNPIYASAEVSALANQIRDCRGNCTNPQCVALWKYLNTFAQDAGCHNSCRIDYVESEMCDLIEHARSGQLTQHLQIFHNMSFNPATQCENFLKRLTDK